MKKTFQNKLRKSKGVLLILISVFLCATSYGQEKNPLFQIQNAFETGELSIDEAILQQINLLTNHDHTTDLPVKCGAPLFLMMEKYEDQISEKTKFNYINAFSSPVSLASESYVSASGKFIIHYETTGTDAVPLSDENNNSIPDYVEWIAEAADFSHVQILDLGFTDIFSVKSMPYEIRVADSDAYGFVPTPNAPYIGIENDFIGFPENDDPEGDVKGAVKVTMAHELKHVFQFVQNGWVGDPDRWLEMDATLYEEVVYDEVNDYYNYLDGFSSNFFGSPRTSLIPGSYEDIAWALYFEERFGNTFWTQVWDEIETESPEIDFLKAVENVLQNFELNFEEATVENLLWHYASGIDNSVLSYGFDERAVYPGPRIEENFVGFQDTLSGIERISRFAGKYFEFDLIDELNQFLRINILPSSSNIQTGLIAFYNDFTVKTRLIVNPTANEHNIDETTFSLTNLDRLGVVFFNSSTTKTDTVQFLVDNYEPILISPQLSQNYPNPFNPTTIIDINLPSTQQVKLTVYDYLGRLVQVLVEDNLPVGITPIPFNASNLASGIYLYRLETEASTITRKMTLIK